MRAINWIGNTLFVLLCLVCAALLGFLIVPRMLGYQDYVVLSGSMEPTYPVGSLIYVKSVDPQDVTVGQPITFVLNEDLVVATHRVVEIDEENQYFYTKGDANESMDGSPVHFKNLIGVPVFSIPYLGYVANYIQSPPGTYIAIALGAVFLLLLFLPDFIRWMKDSPDEKKSKPSGKEIPPEKSRRYLKKTK